MTSGNEQQIARLYASVMQEVKNRLLSIPAVQGLASTKSVEQYFLHEFCYLQLRMTCELIAVSCLLAHDEIPATKTPRVRNLDYPDAIFKELEKLHPEFYPMPVEFTDEHGKPGELSSLGPNAGLRPVRGGYLTRLDLEDLYGLCGYFLHRTPAKRFLAGPTHYEMSNIQEWLNKITALVVSHQIKLINPMFSLWCSFGSTPQSNVYVRFVKRLNQPSPP